MKSLPVWLLAVFVAVSATGAHAESAARGRTLFETAGPDGRGCAQCHGVDPRDNVFGIRTVGTDAEALRGAIARVSGMGVFSTLSGQELADIAAYIQWPEAATQAWLAASPRAVDFGRRASAAPARTAVRIANIGPATVTTRVVLTGGPGFAVASACPAELVADASCTVDITYAPITAGAHAATLSVVGTARNDPLSVRLAGEWGADPVAPAPTPPTAGPAPVNAGGGGATTWWGALALLGAVLARGSMRGRASRAMRRRSRRNIVSRTPAA